jgi:hypothetical protein
MSPCVAKSEREWWAHHEINRLAAEVEKLRGEVAKWTRIRTPTHGSCCTCQACGNDYDSCRCDLDSVADEVAALRSRNEKLEAVATAAWSIKCAGPVEYADRVKLSFALAALNPPDSERGEKC